MRLLADMLKDTTPQNSVMLVELLAAQVVAVAAYKGRRFSTLAEIETAVFEVAGYPMLNRMSPIGGTIEPNVGTEAAKRIADLVGVRRD